MTIGYWCGEVKEDFFQSYFDKPVMKV